MYDRLIFIIDDINHWIFSRINKNNIIKLSWKYIYEIYKIEIWYNRIYKNK